MSSLLSIGAVLWDIFCENKNIGGAPFNLAAHAAALDLNAFILTRLGTDPLGKAALREIKSRAVECDFVQIDTEFPTGTAIVSLDENASATYDIPFEVAYNQIKISDTDIKAMQEKAFDFICFGTIEQKSPLTKAAIERVLEEVRAEYIFYDMNLRQNFYPFEVIDYSLKKANILKLNDDEARITSHLIFNEEYNYGDFCENINQKYGFTCVLITLGGDGCFVFDGKNSRLIPSEPVKVVDTVGAGDAFSAAFISEFIKSKDPFKSAVFGNKIGGKTAAKRGAL